MKIKNFPKYKVYKGMPGHMVFKEISISKEINVCNCYSGNTKYWARKISDLLNAEEAAKRSSNSTKGEMHHVNAR